MTFHLAVFGTPAYFRRPRNHLSRRRGLLALPGDCNIHGTVFAHLIWERRNELRPITAERASARKIARKGTHLTRGNDVSGTQASSTQLSRKPLLDVSRWTARRRAPTRPTGA